jgi:hypothetical protein
MEKLTNRVIRTKIWSGQVSFPSQIPVFEKQSRSDIQWRIVQLYFVRRWSFRHLAKRYGVSPQRIMQLVSKWRVRAMELGYIQEIPPADSSVTQGD